MMTIGSLVPAVSRFAVVPTLAAVHNPVVVVAFPAAVPNPVVAEAGHQVVPIPAAESLLPQAWYRN